VNWADLKLSRYQSLDKEKFMKLLHFTANGSLHLGVKVDTGIIDITEAAASQRSSQFPRSLSELFSGGASALSSLETFVDGAATEPSASWLLDETKIKFAPCVPNPGKIICVGLNYRDHARELGQLFPESPILFSKFNNAVAAHEEKIPLPVKAEKFDYEAELVAVIGKRTRYVEKDAALDNVFGYCIGNDISARDLQIRTHQWLLGKTPDKFFPIGPYLVTADEVGDPNDLNLRLWVNGDQRQRTITSDMIFDVAELVSYTSDYMTLEPGDVISTGTPQGVIAALEEKNWLKPGDEVVVEIEKLGRLSNVMIEER
jgi:2-keto-4-pentenoate hydratase/2-oxohepta-3-ene-1,7-dioic acid hydratase in catechol pathway